LHIFFAATQLRSIRSQVTKSTLDAKYEEYQKLRDDKKTELRDWKVIEWFRQSNSRVIKALRDHLLPKKEKGGPKSAQLRQLFMTSQVTSIIYRENEKIDLETAEQIWDMPVVQFWANILTLFEGKGRSGSSRFWSMICAAVKNVNPKIKGHPGDFAVARNDLQQAWHGLLKMYQDENKPLETPATTHTLRMRIVCVVITAGPSTKLFTWGGGGIWEDMCYERRRAEVCVD
jgi:hypothetical protein